MRLWVGVSKVDGWFDGGWSLAGSLLGFACYGSGFTAVGFVRRGSRFCSRW